MSDTAISSRPKSRLNVGLWVAQGLLAASYGFVGFMKATQPIQALVASFEWPAAVPEALVRLIGVVEVAGAFGLILPMLTKIQPRLTPYAALGLVLLQVCAIIFHISRGEIAMTPFNLILLAIAAFIYWGRTRKLPVIGR